MKYIGRHFNSMEDARIVVTEIEEIIETKIADKKDTLSSKEDLFNVKGELVKDISNLRIDIEKRFNQQII